MGLRGRAASALIGVVVMAVMVVSVYVAFSADEGVPFAESSYAKAAFDDVGALRVGNQVRINQRNVGRVDAIELSGGKAVVTLHFTSERTVYRDGRATILNRSGLGQVYVDVRPGDPGSGALAADEVLPADRTRSYAQVLDVVSELDEPTRKKATSALRQLGGGTAGHGEDLNRFLRTAPELLDDLGTVSRSLAKGNGADLTAMLSSLDRLSARFAGRQQQISAMTGQLATTFDALAVDGGDPMRAAIETAPDTQRKLRTALSALDKPLADTQSAMRTLTAGSRAFGEATPDLRGVLRESAEPFGKLDRFADSADPALRDLTKVARDARPLAPKVTRVAESARTPLTAMAPYAPEIAKWFSYATSALGDGDTAGHWLRFTLIPATDSVTGTLLLDDPLTNSDPYPEPGEAPNQGAPQAPLAGLLSGGIR